MSSVALGHGGRPVVWDLPWVLRTGVRGPERRAQVRTLHGGLYLEAGLTAESSSISGFHLQLFLAGQPLQGSSQQDPWCRSIRNTEHGAAECVQPKSS